jgi:hypothetical protein
MSIYHLHIPRTSGVYIRNNIVPNLISKGIPHFASNRTKIDIETISNSKLVIGHFGRMPLKYMDSPKVFCLLRDPVERYISYFKYNTGYARLDKFYANEKEEKTEENFDHWLYKDQSVVQSNLQSKFLTGSTNIEDFNKNIGYIDHYVNSAWFLQDYSLDIDIIKESTKDINIYTMDNYDKFKFDFNEEVKKQFGFTAFKYSDKSNESPEIKININNSHLKRIKELNEIDYEIYDYVQKTQKRY